MEHIIYYFLENVTTHETRIEITDNLIWNINDKISLYGKMYLVKDYAEEIRE